MTHQLKVGVSVLDGHRIILNRPELAALIGCICSDWAHVENTLSMFYGLLMGVYLPNAQMNGPALHPVALQVFGEVQSIRSRVDLVKKLADWVIKDETQKKDVLAVLEHLKTAGKGRNTAAHGVWGICDSEPDALILMPTFGHYLAYKKDDFELILEKINEAKKELRRIQKDFYDRLQSNSAQGIK